MSELYASVLHLDRKAVQALKITDAYSLHRVVYSLFEDVRSEQEKDSHISSGILYADQGGDSFGRKILLLSNRKPHESVAGEYGQVQTKAIAPEFLGYKQYRFKVQVNPVRKDSQSGKRVAVKGRDEIADWFLQRTENNWGFSVVASSLQIDTVEVLQFKGKNDQPITVGKAHLQGSLTVTDQNQFQQSFKLGIGKGRAFGCGLLQVVPIIDNPFA